MDPLFLAQPWFSIMCLCVVMACCVAGVLSYQFDDTLLQHLGMAVVCLAALVEVLYLATSTQADPGAALLYAGTALYGLATGLKVWRRWRRAGRPGHPFRRSTDFGAEPLPNDQRGRRC